MSENVGGVPSTPQASQGSAKESSSFTGEVRRESSVPSSARKTPGSPTARPGQSAHDQGSAPGKDAGASDGVDKPKFDLPDELDLDSLDEEGLKKLANWRKKVRINGKEKVVTLPEFLRLSQKEMAADEKFTHSSQLEKQQKALIEALRSDPASVLEKLGYDVDELAKQRLARRLQLEAMSPEQREAYQARMEAEQYKAKLLEQEQQRAAQMEQQITEQKREYWQKSILGALEKSGLPPDPLALKLTAQFVQANHQRGFKDFTPEDAIPMVKDFCTKMARFYFNAVPPQELFKELGTDFDQRIRKFLLDQVQNPIKEQFKIEPQAEVPNSARPNREERKPLTPDQAREELRKKFG